MQNRENCITYLQQVMDQNIDKFLGWDYDESYSIVGLMRATGYKAASGVALVFEKFEYDVKEIMIKPMAYCIATFPITNYYEYGEGLKILLDDYPTIPGKMEVESRGNVFQVMVDIEEMIQRGYLPSGSSKVSDESLLYKLCDTIPKDWLFSEVEHLKTIFKMPLDTQLIFMVDDWEHITTEEIIDLEEQDEAFRVSNLPDIEAMIESVCTGVPPKLVGKPNTHWRILNKIDEDD